MIDHSQFVSWFRSAAPYIHAFRGRTFVVAFGGEVVAGGNFTALTRDFNLLASLGVRLVLVHGSRAQIERRLSRKSTRFVRGMRVTDDKVLVVVKEENGRLRTEIEALLSMGIANAPMADTRLKVAGGNFVVARPVGVLDGVDMLHTGEVRKIDTGAIRGRLDSGEVVLISPLGYSPTGEVFNLGFEEVATETAIALAADKLIFLVDGPQAGRGAWRELAATQAERLIAHADATQTLKLAVRACRNQVERVHFVSREADGGLLLELFTHEGVGTMITQDPLERLRQATIEDAGGILRLIEPMEADGTLVKRNRERLETEIGRFTVLEHDRMIVGCAALYPFNGAKAGELACLAVHAEHQGGGAGERLLRHVEDLAKKQGLRRLFVLTTKTAHWFAERGFSESAVAELPPEKKSLYNLQRRSKVLAKKLA
ncbi:MAG: amino-acid N-acetyltransferase [Betaproteobacteria bacterium]|nr:amino-acid N-acetyltransferase [Betaproteobacteria bacterium]